MNDLITQKNYRKRIEKGTLDELLERNLLTKEEVLIDEEAIAFSIIDSHLQERYETDGLFNPKMSKGSLPLIGWVVSIVLHQLYCNKEKPIPNSVLLNYVSTMKELEDVRTGRQLVDLPEKDLTALGWDENELDLEDDLDFESPVYWGI